MKNIKIIFFLLLSANSPLFAGNSTFKKQTRWQKFQERMGDAWTDIKDFPSTAAQTVKEEYHHWKKNRALSQNNIEKTWASIQKDAKGLKKVADTDRSTVITNFLNAINDGNVNDSLQDLFGAHLTIFDTTKDGKSIFEVLKDNFKASPQSNKRLLMLFVMHKLIEQSANSSLASQEYEDSMDKNEALDDAREELGDLITAEKAWQETK